jgi:hypothetical protein
MTTRESSVHAEIGHLEVRVCTANVMWYCIVKSPHRIDLPELSKQTVLVLRNRTACSTMSKHVLILLHTVSFDRSRACCSAQRNQGRIWTLPLATSELKVKCGDWAHVKLHAKAPLKPGSGSINRVVAKGCQASPGTLCNA